jgi:hypothetical protein
VSSKKQEICECGHTAKFHEGWSAPGRKEPGCSKQIYPDVFCNCMEWKPVKGGEDE